MSKRGKGLKIISSLALGFFTCCIYTQDTIRAESSARSLFMSTAGSLTQVEDKGSTKGKISMPKKEATSKKRTQVAQNTADSWSSGLQIQVLRVKGNLQEAKLEPINPNKYIFSEGERFKVRVTVNLPGVIMFYNIDPKGESSYLGAWPIEKAFTSVELPYEGYFEFYGAKGVDKLYVVFKPCLVESTLKSQFMEKTNYSRSIRLVQTDLTDKVNLKDEVKNALPVCTADLKEYTQDSVNRKIYNYATYSRSIRTVYDKTDSSVYAFTSQSQRNTNRNIEGDLIMHVLNLRFK